MGKSATGKDTVYHRLIADESLHLERIVPYTTRPMRIKEKDGDDYFFVTPERFREMLAQDRVIESRTYQTVQGPWTYFTADDGQIRVGGPGGQTAADHDSADEAGDFIMVGTLEVYEALCRRFGKENIVPLYIEASDEQRLERAMRRERKQNRPDYAEMCRRFLADNEDFSEEKLSRAGIVKRYDNTELDACVESIRGDILSEA